MKTNNLDCNSLITSYISDKQITFRIYQNIAFVEKYVNVVDGVFKDINEKQIAYRELGSIVYSCVEALLKSVIVEINRRCKNKGCSEEKCPYRKYKTARAIDNLRQMNALRFLLDTRLFGLVSHQIDDIYKLNDLRNYVHLSKAIYNGNKDDLFTKKYVETMLGYYYEMLDQLNLCGFYFESDNACLKDLDDNGFNSTTKQMSQDLELMYLMKAYGIMEKVFFRKELSNEDKWILIKICDVKFVKQDKLVKLIADSIIYYNRFFKTDGEYEAAKIDFLNSLIAYSNNKSFGNRLLKTFKT